MFGILKKIFGTEQGRLLNKRVRLVRKINAIEKELQTLSDEELTAKTEEFKKRYAEGESLEALLVEAYAVVKNACRRSMGTDVHVSG